MAAEYSILLPLAAEFCVASLRQPVALLRNNAAAGLLRAATKAQWIEAIND